MVGLFATACPVANVSDGSRGVARGLGMSETSFLVPRVYTWASKRRVRPTTPELVYGFRNPQMPGAGPRIRGPSETAAGVAVKWDSARGVRWKRAQGTSNGISP